MSFSAVINQSLNGIVASSTYLLNKGGHVIAPAVLGYTGGWLTRVGPGKGLIQGLTSGVYHIVIYRPAVNYIQHNKGEGPDKLQEETVNFWKVIEGIAGIAVPILVTKYFGDLIVDRLTSMMSEKGTLRWLLTIENPRDYTVMMGILVNIAPAISQHWISAWREEDKSNKKKT